MTETGKDRFSLDELLHPARAFGHPNDVIADRDLTVNEKRAILASWASDASAVDDEPALRMPTDGPPVSFDDIMDALKTLDQETRVDHSRFVNRARRLRDLYRERGQGGILG